MAKTISVTGKAASDAPNDQLASAVRDSAEQIWLAGLGAFAKAQQEGTKVFEALVREGDLLQRRTRAVTEERLEEFADRFTEATTQLTRQASQSWDRLEQVFEDRVARALSHLGVPSTRDIRELTEMLKALDQRISELDAMPAARQSAPSAKAARQPAAGGRGAKKAGAGQAATAAPTSAQAPAPTPRAARVRRSPVKS